MGALPVRASLLWLLAAVAAGVSFEQELPARPLNETYFLPAPQPPANPRRDPKREPDDIPVFACHRA